MHWLIAFVLLVVPINSMGGDRAESASVIEMEHYLVQSKLGREWDMKTYPESQAVQFTQEEKKGPQTIRSRLMIVIEKDASRIYESVHSERWIADAYRRGEESNMIAQGVMKGMYQLEDVEKSEIDIHDKHFYTMTYKQLFDSHIGYGYLYLHFPSDFKEKNIFYAFLYSEIKLLSDKREIDLSYFYSLIGSFNIKEDAGGVYTGTISEPTQTESTFPGLSDDWMKSLRIQREMESLKYAQDALARGDLKSAYRLLEDGFISNHIDVKQKYLAYLERHPEILEAARDTFSVESLKESIDENGNLAREIESKRLSTYSNVAPEKDFLKARKNYESVFNSSR